MMRAGAAGDSADRWSMRVKTPPTGAAHLGSRYTVCCLTRWRLYRTNDHRMFKNEGVPYCSTYHSGALPHECTGSIVHFLCRIAILGCCYVSARVIYTRLPKYIPTYPTLSHMLSSLGSHGP